MPKRDYPREKAGKRLAFGGMNTVNPPDQMPPNKFPYAQNVRAYLHDRIAGRAVQDSSVLGTNLISAVHTIRRLNDSTPDGPVNGFILVNGAGVFLYASYTPVAKGLSGNPLSLVPFRPAASVQPWMYVGDSQLTGVKIEQVPLFIPVPNGMLKVRSDGTCYSMGIEEPQVAPGVSFIPISNVVSLVGEVLVWVWNLISTNSQFIWHNPSDPGSTNTDLSTPFAALSTTGNSLQFDLVPSTASLPVEWGTYDLLIGTVNTVGTAVTWVSGSQFADISAGQTVIIGSQSYTVAASPAPTNTTFSTTTSVGTLTDVNYYAAVLSGTVPMYQPALGLGSYEFTAAVLATLYIPAPGIYQMNVTYCSDIIWGIGGNALGNPSWANVYPVSSFGQTKTIVNAYPLLGRNTTGSSPNFSGSGSVGVYFPFAGNYPIEIDWGFGGIGGFLNQRTLVVTCTPPGGGSPQQIAPLPATVITEAQYRYTYRSSATGATSNPSPPSLEQPLSVLANILSATPSTDIQVDKIDFYRLDIGNENFTYVGTISNGIVETTTTEAVTATGTQTLTAASYANMSVGESLDIDSGANEETITISALNTNPLLFGNPITSFTAVFAKTHLSGVPLVGTDSTFTDSLLDTDIANNPILDFDNYQPFPSIDLPRSGVVTADSGVVSWVSGDQFNQRWLGGTVIIVGTVAYTLDKRPTSATQLTCSNIEVLAGAEVIIYPTGSFLPYEIAEPILAAQPLPYMWGPTDNVSFAFAVGDPLRPGTLYWSKGNDLDAAPDTNQQDITSPSEPLQNGCIVNGLGLVFSTERAFFIYPNFFNALATVQGTEGSTWTIQETISTRGLYIPRCLAVDGGGNVFFRAKDGILISPGGQGAKSITDADLYNLFPHEGMVPQPVTRGVYTVYPPDDTNPEAQQLHCANGYLYYDYRDASDTPRTLVFDIAAGGWVVDQYQYPAITHVLEEGVVNGVLTGNVDGSIRNLDNTGGEQTASVVLMPSETAGDIRAPKHWGDCYVEAEEGE